MYLIDTNVISEIRKEKKADIGVQEFFQNIITNDLPVYISAVTIGELRRGIEQLRHRNDNKQAIMLEAWLSELLKEYENNILAFDVEAAQVWGYLRVPHYEHVLDKQIAATALVNNLTVVTRNVEDFVSSGVELLNPFTQH